ncbi:histidine kinase [Hyphomicrobium facile]|uniref:Oxygen sensor histidine kinase NreB n=1 Tax=Hyphomicrobium facile TaxID=51670 RepID=A0A1I7NH79_9HYPH|nr:ATP-binding protein [Hyphomicrobium facile]SFV34027.1 two-component system, NarL family, sensor histidine kinase UhpB [Hyphomicrobium facile]
MSALSLGAFAGRVSDTVWRGRSIRNQVLLAMSALLVFASIVAGAVAVYNGRKAVNVEIDASLDFAEGYIRELVQRAAAQDKLADLDHLVAREVQHLRHARVYVQEPGASPRLLRPELTLRDEVSTLDKTPDWFEKLMKPESDSDHSRVIVVPNGERSLLLQGDPDDEIAESWQELSALAVVAIASITLLIGAFYFVLGWILDPLVALARGLVALEAGERSQRLSIPRLGEVADIARKFNSLAASLDQARAENGELYRQIQSVQEEERREIARELHDEAGPCLFGITANAESVARLAAGLKEGDAARIAKRVEEILSITDRLKVMNRELLKRLHPVSIGKVPMTALIEDLIRDFERRHPEVRIVSSVGPFARAYGDRIDLIVYRATQEALTNAMRHGHAENIVVELKEEAGRSHGAAQNAPILISLRVSDDGKGLRPGARAGFGLSAMRERVLSAGGSLVVDGHEPNGTTLSIKIPALPSDDERYAMGANRASA